MHRNLKRSSRLFKDLSSMIGLMCLSGSAFALCGSLAGDDDFMTHVNFALYNWASPDPKVAVYGQVATRADSKHGLDQASNGNLISPNPNPASPTPIPFGGSSAMIDPSMAPVAIDCYHADIGATATTYYSLAFLVSDSTEDAQNPNLFLTAALHMISQGASVSEDGVYDLSLRATWIVNPIASCSGSSGTTLGCAALSQSSLLSNSNWVLNGSFSDLGAFPYSVSSPYSVLQPGLVNSSATQLLWPSTLKFNAVNNFYGVTNFLVTINNPQADHGSFITNGFGLVCENITGVGNTCPWFGVDSQGSRPQLPPLSSS